MNAPQSGSDKNAFDLAVKVHHELRQTSTPMEEILIIKELLLTCYKEGARAQRRMDYFSQPAMGEHSHNYPEFSVTLPPTDTHNQTLPSGEKK